MASYLRSITQKINPNGLFLSFTSWLALLLLCSAYLQGPLCKLLDLKSAAQEMQHFGLHPAMPFAIGVIAFELVACTLVLTGKRRWEAALALAAFTLFANFLANPFWSMPKPVDMMVVNGFFEHLGLIGGFIWVAVDDLRASIKQRRSFTT